MRNAFIIQIVCTRLCLEASKRAPPNDTENPISEQISWEIQLT